MKDIFATITASIFTSATVLACSVTNETTPVKVELDATVAKSQASALTAAVTAAESEDGTAIADAVASIGDVAAALVPPTKPGAQSHGQRTAASTSCTCPSRATSCTFRACTIGDATVSGTIAWTSGTITCTDLSIDASSTAHVAVTCALTYTSGSIAGTVHTTGSATVSGTTYAWDATLAANAITFTSSALTGGSLDVSITGTTSTTADGETSYSASAVVTLP